MVLAPFSEAWRWSAGAIRFPVPPNRAVEVEKSSSRFGTLRGGEHVTVCSKGLICCNAFHFRLIEEVCCIGRLRIVPTVLMPYGSLISLFPLLEGLWGSRCKRSIRSSRTTSPYPPSLLPRLANIRPVAQDGIQPPVPMCDPDPEPCDGEQTKHVPLAPRRMLPGRWWVCTAS